MEQLFPALIFVLLGSTNADYQCVCNYDLSAKVYDAVTSGHVVDTMNEFDCKPLKTKVSGSSWASIVLSDHSTAFVQTGGMVLVQTCPGDPPTAATTTPTSPPTTRKTTTPTPTTTTPKPTPAPNIPYGPVCDSGWTPFEKSCYLFPQHIKLSFTDAQDFCKSEGGHLVHIDYQPENHFIEDEVNRFQDKDFWLGLNDRQTEGQWRWSDTNSPPTFTNWNPGEPFYFFKDEDCVFSRGDHSNRWYDTTCSSQYRPVCEKQMTNGSIFDQGWVEFNGSLYLVPPAYYRRNFSAAEAFCQAGGAYLVNIGSQAENDFIKQQVQTFRDRDFWLGLNDRQIEGQWLWSDTNSPPTFTNWNPGEPFYLFKDEDCVVSYGDQGSRWYDITCFSEFRPVCEKRKPKGGTSDLRWIEFNKSYYLFPSSLYKRNFSEAELFCQKQGGHLVHIDSRTESYFVNKHVQASTDQDYWLGLNDRDTEGQWRWCDTKTPPMFTDWFPGEPMHFLTDEDCVVSLGNHRHKWFDRACASEFVPVCEKQ